MFNVNRALWPMTVLLQPLPCSVFGVPDLYTDSPLFNLAAEALWTILCQTPNRQLNCFTRRSSNYRETFKVGSRSISYLIGNLFRVNVFKSTCASGAASFMGNEARIIAFITP